MNRRTILQAGIAAPLLGMPAVTRAQDFNQTVRIVVPFGPGGTSDILARLIAPSLSARIGQNVVVENRAGAGGNIGADAVAKSRPDGHSMVLLDISALATNPWLFARMPFDPLKDLAPVQMVVFAPYILAVNNALPVRNAEELAAYAKANPGRLNAANSGTGTLTHLVALSLARHWGGAMEHVPYRGGAPALLSLVANESNLTMAGSTQSMNYVVNGQMRGIAVTGPRRFPNLPDLPTFRELGWPEPDAGTWQGILVQGQTPPAMIARLEREIAAVLNEPAIKARIGEIGGEVQADGADSFRRRLIAQTESYGEIIRANNVRLE
ncbi:Bug family tripartite tricarboxylate transporter substrate binding protein [Falsiroseomonas stagni]|uniref:Tripartite-type tricarboxylate transporter, receptor component TctC n=1 Tax=Falsiroseomonas stagni DSM 19981 TaxID=1123062 RepID=A0A1I4B751_9PROT|nr:tripartite tricarboxylate transporter substrate binding protein [Falsiroseomonas stagni]SFK64353.1 Tripartite-type tricarboxylate transporter, receptor component TctC [Falsiroseomonas stagni DSM 19981]